MAPILIYCYDAYCGWCYGFTTQIKRVASLFQNQLQVEVLSGGMIITESPVHISATAVHIQNAYKRVEETTGVKFGDDYLWHIFNPDKSDWFPSSEKPAIALVIFKELAPGLQLDFAADLQCALHAEGRDLDDDEAYRHLLEKYSLDVTDFYRKLHAGEYKDKAYYEFALVKQLHVTGYPTVILQLDDSKLYLVARGYTDYETLRLRVENILRENKIDLLK